MIAPGTERYAHLDGLRGIAAFNVVLSHAAQGIGFTYWQAVAVATLAFMLVAIGLASLAVGLVELPAVRIASGAAAAAQDGVERALATARTIARPRP